MSSESPSIPYLGEIRWILQAGMLLFIYTVVVGILNGLDLVDFERKALLTHLHIGTLAWITGGVFAGALVLFGSKDPDNKTISRLAVAAPLVAAAYNVAFLTTTNLARPILGTLMMIILLGFAFWGFRQARGTTLSVPHLGILAGLATSVIGAVFGVFYGIIIANPDSGIPSRLGEAHPAAMVVGFLVPVGMVFSEWVLNKDATLQPASRAGWLQIGLPFLGGVAVVVGLLLDLIPLIMLSLPFEIIGIAIFVVRMIPNIRTTSFFETGNARYGVIASIFVVVNLCIFVYLIVNYISQDDFDSIPRRLMLALDHSIFIGVLTVALIPFIGRYTLKTYKDFIDHVMFWGLSVGTIGFMVGLLVDTDILIRVFTPILGLAILHAIGVFLPAMGNPMGVLKKSLN